MAKSKRVKTAASEHPVPQSQEEAREYVQRIGISQRERARLETEMEEEIEALKARYAEKADPLSEEIQALASGVQTWCEANRARLTNEGRRKFFDLASGRVQWRWTPPRVSIRKKDDVIDAIRKLRFGRRFLRMKPEINKEAMLRAPELAKKVEGVSISQREEFVITPSISKLEEVV